MTAVAVEPRAAAAIPRDPAWWGILLFIVTEATLFALLLVSYFYLRFEEPGPWPPAGDEPPKLLIPLIMTLLLMASSVPAYLADKSIRRGEVDRLRLYLASTLVLGAAFLGLQAFEYHSELDILRPQSDAYGSLFYTITSLHGAHVVVGLALLGWVLVWAFRNHYGADRHLAVEISSLYWHFVHVVWLFVFLSLYLSPRI